MSAHRLRLVRAVTRARGEPLRVQVYVVVRICGFLTQLACKLEADPSEVADLSPHCRVCGPVSCFLFLFRECLSPSTGCNRVGVRACASHQCAT